MKADFIDRLIKIMIEDADFLPLKTVENSLDIEGRISILSKNLIKDNIIVEVLDADLFLLRDIRDRMDRNTEVLSSLQKNVKYHLFEVFIFNNTPDDEKFNSIRQRQFQNVIQRKYLNSIVVDLSNGMTKNLFSPKFTDFGLQKVIEKLLSNNFSEDIIKRDINEIVEEKKKDYKVEIQTNKPYTTYILMAVNIIVFLILFVISNSGNQTYGELLSIYGAKDNLRIMTGEYWRFVTPIFLHGDIMHLLFNSYALFILGPNAEKILGKSKYLFVYFLAGIIGNIISFIFSTNPGVGASGSIFGLLGTMLFLGVMKPVLFKNYFGRRIISIIFINLFIGFSNERIDNAAHIGGLIGGFLSTGIIFIGERIKWYTYRSFYIILTVALIVLSINIGFNTKENKLLLKVVELTVFEENEEWSNAEYLSEEILDLHSKNIKTNATVLVIVIKAEAYAGKYNEAIEHCKELVKYDSINGHYILGQLYFNTGEYELAKEELLKAKQAGLVDQRANQILDDIEKLRIE